MNLDCTETDDGKWRIVDYDNYCKQIALADSVEEAWYDAAMILENRINEGLSLLEKMKGGLSQ